MITLTNDFHNTEATVRIAELQPGQVRQISRSTYNRIRRELCGMSDCQCGDVRGCDYGMFSDPTGRYFLERRGG